MRKRLVFVIIVLSVAASLFSAVVPESGRIASYLRSTVSPSFVSEKVYSYPAKNGSLHFALGADISADLFRNDGSAKWGFSTALYASYPLISKNYENFVGSDIADRKGFLMASAGISFRCTPSPYVDASLALRAAVLSLDYFREGVIMGLTVESMVDFFFTDSIFITGGLSLTNGFIKFTPSSGTAWFESGYSMLLFRARIGAGYRFGGDRKR